MNPSNYSSISFPFLGLEVNPPRSLSLGPLNIYLYGVAIALGLILAVVYVCRRRHCPGGFSAHEAQRPGPPHPQLRQL